MSKQRINRTNQAQNEDGAATQKHAEQAPATLPILRKALTNPQRLTPANLLSLQHTLGNQAVQRLFAQNKARTLPARVLTSPQKATIQRYFKITNADFADRNVNLGATTFYGQDKDTQDGSATKDTFLKRTPKLNGGFTTEVRTSNRGHDALDLRVANDGDLAIEENDLEARQAKVFFADATLVPAWNTKLAKRGGVQLRLGNETIQVPNRADDELKTLTKITPAVGLDGVQNCDDMAGRVTGAGAHKNLKVKAPANGHANAPGGNLNDDDAHLRMAKYITEYLTNGQNADLAAQNSNLPALDMSGGIEQVKARLNQRAENVARLYGPQLHQAINGGNAQKQAFTQLITDLGINQFANAEVGDAFMTVSVGAREDNGAGGAKIRDYEHQPVVPDGEQPRYVNNAWNYHWGGVVAQSGDDKITLENYARGKEDKNMPISGLDDRYYFQMYGSPTERDNANQPQDQSWHGVWKNLGFGNPITMAMTHNTVTEQWMDGKADELINGGLNNIKNDHATLNNPPSADAEEVGLLKGLAYAKYHIAQNKSGRRSRVNAWKAGILMAEGRNNPKNVDIVRYTKQKMNQVSKGVFVR